MDIGVVTVTLKKADPAELVHGSTWTHDIVGAHAVADTGGGDETSPSQSIMGVGIICATEVPSAIWAGSSPVACANVAGA
eukprot:3698830-Prymnesium_polylepis.1